ncbi:MAG TPA: glycosyltransferase family 9 protein [Chitinophagaceae bacterium]|nr:glycosyltransferase family 9 protein [Chitinophagaceae bacterium]
MPKFLIIQTAFPGDVILATGLIEKLHQHFPNAQTDFLVRKGNEGLLMGHPYINEVLVWDKTKNKLGNLLKMRRRIRKNQYDKLINLQRFASTGFLTAFSGAKEKIGFDKNPWSFRFTKKIKHVFGNDKEFKHEIERNHELIADFTDHQPAKPVLYPTKEDVAAVSNYKNQPYIVIAPGSVWFTKQYPAEKWIELINKLPQQYKIYLVGSPAEEELSNTIEKGAIHPGIINLAGKLSFLQSASLMKDSIMNYVNDSAPMHLASAMNAPVTAIYCSTVTSFGFGPLSDKSFVVEIKEKLECRPCGIHGYKACPLGHFNCAFKIEVSQLLETLNV